MTDLASLSWPQVDRRGPGSVLAVPLGATEQHGPHLPLGTDTEIAVAIAALAAAELDHLVVAPPLPFGSSGEHADFPGTLSIGREATELVLVELCRSACADFGRVVLVSAHGGNAEPLRAAVARLRDEGRDVLAFSPRWEGDAHAGRTETSLMLAIEPAWVREARAAAGNAEPLQRLLPALRAGGVRAVSANGVLGDPAGASAAEGAALLAAAARQLVAVLRGERRGEAPDAPAPARGVAR
ncbi:MAG: mycofactocin biosynthesis peptidyl-dipeptidase MftE [Solirubrobacterales bacterium]